ncbi:DHA2 family efflux MFS transporter permease subunit [Paenibacillus polymyxa]|uniref:DHA2 family efflux MFS transporter permease subunit n=1 Tax=Paenibacillus TaxID=44249 RepID=UPI000885710B|nr:MULTISPECIES: DHA2 family efflux MFS transporter permease subunit [Paenibacillus]MCL6658916.1 DHA2 family efflux MFS transporter permease subunit [Paenibacillus amylolyticus]WJM11339.1 DHA2 family efflux MFS transporter permease subunit [Paenibacillus sp. PK1-4R]SDC68611.1 MFS transporter, DHA2 family, lincomycin resistance protein [Paenibacillus sp. CF095]
MKADSAQNQQETKQYKVFPILFAMLLSGFIGLFGETALNVALTPLMGLLEVGPTTIQWLTTGYLLVLGILVPVSGMLLQWFSTRQLFTTSLIFSIAGTFVAALAPSFEILLVARVLQAVGTALLLPLMFNTILVIFPIEKRGAAMGLIGLVIMFAPASGPSISGLILANLSWHWIFWISLPFFIISLVCGLLFLPNISKLTKPKIDVLSIILSTLGFGGIVYGFSSAGGHGETGGGWTSPVVVATLVIGVLSLLLFSIRQLRMKQPMMDLRAFRYPMFTIGLILIFISMMMMLSSMLILPMYLQQGMAVTALTAGLVLLPGSLLNGFLSPIMGRLFDKFGPKWLVIIGMAIVSVVLFLYTGIEATTSLGTIITLHVFMMVGISMIMMPAQTNGLNQLPPEFYPHGTAIMNTLQQVSGAIGTAVAVSILSAGQTRFLSSVANPETPENQLAGFTSGVQNAFVFALVLAVIGLIISLFVKRVKVGAQAGQQGPMH